MVEREDFIISTKSRKTICNYGRREKELELSSLSKVFKGSGISLLSQVS